MADAPLSPFGFGVRRMGVLESIEQRCGSPVVSEHARRRVFWWQAASDDVTLEDGRSVAMTPEEYGEWMTGREEDGNG